MKTTLEFTDSVPVIKGATALIVVGPLTRLKDDATIAALPKGARAAWPAMIESLKPGDSGASATTWLARGTCKRIIAIALPSACSRHNIRSDHVLVLYFP